jgi:hypothetical protein
LYIFANIRIKKTTSGKKRIITKKMQKNHKIPPASPGNKTNPVGSKPSAYKKRGYVIT